MNDNDMTVPTASDGDWEIADPREWMTFREAREYVGETGVRDPVKAIVARANDGLIACGARRTELVFEQPDKAPARRKFTPFDAARFGEMQFSQVHGTPCPVIQEAETLTTIHEDFDCGDFKLQVECTNPPYRVSLFAWGMVFKRKDVVGCFAPPPVPPVTVPGMSFDEVVAWCRDFISSGRGNGMDRAWEAFKPLPDSAGIARDTFFRAAWREAKTKQTQ